MRRGLTAWYAYRSVVRPRRQAGLGRPAGIHSSRRRSVVTLLWNRAFPHPSFHFRKRRLLMTWRAPTRFAHLLRRVPRGAPERDSKVALALMGLVALGALWPLAAVSTVGGPTASTDFRLHQPLEYLILAPFVRLLDELSLLSAQQHGDLWWSVAAMSTAWAALRAWGRTSSDATLKRTAVTWRGTVPVVRDLIGPALVVALLYVVGALVPRPMVALRARRAADVLVDFHSHTDRSHDGRWGFGVESNREWHAGAGFDAEYITDHQTMGAWQRLAARGELSRRRSPVREATLSGGSSVSLQSTILPGIETAVPGAHLTLLGVDARHDGLFRHARDLDTVAFAAAAERPVVILTLPFDLTRSPERAPRIDAIEISDGSPRGLGFARANRGRILNMADSLRIPIVASSNLHGWGSTAVAWTVLRLEGWQQMTPAQLDQQIRATLLHRPTAVRVVERNALDAGHAPFAAWFTAPRLVWHSVRIASPLERYAFVAWIWVVWLARRSAETVKAKREEAASRRRDPIPT